MQGACRGRGAAIIRWRGKPKTPGVRGKSPRAAEPEACGARLSDSRSTNAGGSKVPGHRRLLPTRRWVLPLQESLARFSPPRAFGPQEEPVRFTADAPAR